MSKLLFELNVLVCGEWEAWSFFWWTSLLWQTRELKPMSLECSWTNSQRATNNKTFESHFTIQLRSFIVSVSEVSDIQQRTIDREGNGLWVDEEELSYPITLENVNLLWRRFNHKAASTHTTTTLLGCEIVFSSTREFEGNSLTRVQVIASYNSRLTELSDEFSGFIKRFLVVRVEARTSMNCQWWKFLRDSTNMNVRVDDDVNAVTCTLKNSLSAFHEETYKKG